MLLGGKGCVGSVITTTAPTPPGATPCRHAVQLCYGRHMTSQEPTRPTQPRSRWGRGWGGVLDRSLCEENESGPSTCLSLSLYQCAAVL